MKGAAGGGAHPAAAGLEAARRVGEVVSEALGPSGAPFVLLPGSGSGSGQVIVSAAGSTAVSGRRLRQWARSPGILALLERSAAALDLGGGGATTVLTMLEGAIRRIQAECRAGGESFARLQRISLALAECECWMRREVIAPAMRRLEFTQNPPDFWSLVPAVLHTAIAGKVGQR
jgi:hypothetical protein